jgi:hypothetical protein
MVVGMMVAVAMMDVADRHLAAVVLVAMQAGRIFVGQNRGGHRREQGRAGGGDQ